MNKILYILAIATPLCVTIGDDLVVGQFDGRGMITFEEVEDAISYRVQWSSNVIGGWTNFAGDYGLWLDHIPAAAGGGAITASVPMFYRVVATMPPSNMVYIPAGGFMMGNSTNVFPEEEGSADELPQHYVYTDALYVDKYEVPGELWRYIKAYSTVYMGYVYSNYYDSYDGMPKTDLTWYDAVRWCNARSEIEGLTPVYYTDASFTNVFRTHEPYIYPDWSANGYRLPTEAEWEKAARGGVEFTRFPWSDYTNRISHARANYQAGFLSYDLSTGSHPLYSPVSPVGSFPPNDFNLYDMAGNVFEWCWDWYDETYYASSPVTNPTGPSTGTVRVYRGGSFLDYSSSARCASRAWFYPGIMVGIEGVYNTVGLRCVRRP